MIWGYSLHATPAFPLASIFPEALTPCWLFSLIGTKYPHLSCTYILMAQEGFKLPTSVASPAGIAFAVTCFWVFMWNCVMGKGKNANAPVQEIPYELEN